MEKTLKQLFLKEQKSASQIGKIIGLTTNQVYGQLTKYGIRKNKPKITEWYNQKLKNFTDEEIYILGFLWADGYLNGSDRKRNLQCEIVYNDFICLEKIFDKVGRWGRFKRKASIKNGVSRQSRMSLIISDTKLIDKFFLLDFDKKSFVCPYKLLKKIPKNKHYLFYRGYVDGDGCFYITDRAKQFSLSSTYDQDWSHIENLFKNLNIKKYKIQKNISKLGHQDSRIRTSNIDDLTKLVNYLYQDRLDIGLKRKYDKVASYILTKDSY